MSELLERLAAGDVRTLARAVSLVEDGVAGAAELLAGCRSLGRHARRIGVTGPPGAGKSTLVDRMVATLRAGGETVAVVAVDPSSPYTGGALLGDRVRMNGFAGDSGVFVRSMASRGELGGLARGVADVCAVIEAAGFGTILIETVGVGQDEVGIAALADVTALVLVPGMGDDVQSLKAGVMEIADIFVVNKADLPGAERVESEILAMQGLGGHGAGWLPPVVRTVATSGAGVEELLGAVERRLGAENSQRQKRNTEILRFAQNDLGAGRDLGGGRNLGAGNDLGAGRGLGAGRDLGAGRNLGTQNDLGAGRGLGTQNDLGAGSDLRLDHLGIAVKSIAAAKGFYELLGMAVTHEETVEHEQVKTAMLPLGETRIELLEPTAEDSTIGRFLAKRGEGLHHVAVRVAGIDERFAAMQAAGIRLASDQVRVGAGGHRYFFVHPASTGGVLVELVGE